MHAIHNSWRNFEEPQRFLPERWLAPGAEYARPLQGGELAATSGEHWELSLKDLWACNIAEAIQNYTAGISVHPRSGLRIQGLSYRWTHIRRRP